MTYRKTEFVFLNAGHFFDHFFMLIFASAAALQLSKEWPLSYAELIPYATAGFITFAVFALPAGWLADKWSRVNMMAIFFIGIGASSVLAGFTNTPMQMAAALALLGLFAAIYHPVGLAMVVHERTATGMAVAINGVFGNLGVACAALFTGLIIDGSGWRSAFIAPGLLCICIGLLYVTFIYQHRTERTGTKQQTTPNKSTPQSTTNPAQIKRILSIVLISTALGGLIFQSTTFVLPKIVEERLSELAGSATAVGAYTFVVFSIAAVAQLVVGYLLDRHSLRHIFMVVALLQACFFTLMINLSGTPALFTAMAFMLAVFGQIPINDVLIGRIASNEWRSRILAVRYLVTFSVMASALPIIAGIYTTSGFKALFMVLALAALCIAIAVYCLPKMAATQQQKT